MFSDQTLQKLRIKICDTTTIKSLENEKLSVNRNRDYAIGCLANKILFQGGICYNKIFKIAVALRGKEIWIFTKDLGIAPYRLTGEIDKLIWRSLTCQMK